MTTTLGRRNFDRRLDPIYYRPGEYGLWGSEWWARAPNGALANLGRHSITCHNDGTISADPSIRVSRRENGRDVEMFHGFLKHGIWETR